MGFESSPKPGMGGNRKDKHEPELANAPNIILPGHVEKPENPRQVVVPGVDDGNHSEKPPLEIIEPYEEKVAREREEERKAAQAKPWKLGREADTIDFETLENRRDWLELVFISEPKDMKTSFIRQELSEIIETNLAKAQESNSQTGLGRKLQDTEALKRAKALMGKLEVESNASFLQLLDSAEDVKDLQAIRLLGLGLLEEGYSKGKQESFKDLPEEHKKLVRVGEMLGMEAERKILERQIVAGKLNDEKALKAYKRYKQYASNIDIPPLFRERFKGMSAWLNESFGFQAEAQIKKKHPYQPAGEKEHGRVSSPELSVLASDELGYEKDLRERFAASTKVPPKYLENFYNDLDQQIEYAYFLDEKPKSLFGKMYYNAAKRSFKFFTHYEVFGARGAFRTLLDPSGADQEMTRVRGEVRDIIKKQAQESGGNDSQQQVLKEYARILSHANSLDNADRRKYNIRQENMKKGTSSIINKAWEGLQDMRKKLKERKEEEEWDEILQGVYGSGEHTHEDGYVPDFSDVETKDTVRSLFRRIGAWHEENPVASFDDWKLDVSSEDIRLLEKEAKVRKMDAEKVWSRLAMKNTRRRAA